MPDDEDARRLAGQPTDGLAQAGDRGRRHPRKDQPQVHVREPAAAGVHRGIDVVVARDGHAGGCEVATEIVAERPSVAIDHHAVEAGEERSLARRGRPDRLDSFQRQPDGERRAAPGGALQRDRTLHQLDQRVADREPEPGPAEAPGRRGIGLRERPEQPGLHVRVDADAVVDHDQLHDHAIGGRVDDHRAHRHLAARDVAAAELDRVAGEVHEDLADAHRVAVEQPGNRGVDEHRHPHVALRGDVLGHAADLLDDFREVERLLLDDQLPRFDLREVEDVLDDAEQLERGVADQVDHLHLVVVEAGLVKHVDHPDHAVHRRADLVAHRREEVGLCLVRLLRDVPRLLQLHRAAADATSSSAFSLRSASSLRLRSPR